MERGCALIFYHGIGSVRTLRYEAAYLFPSYSLFMYWLKHKGLYITCLFITSAFSTASENKQKTASILETNALETDQQYAT
jgi:hypothetical protein